ncbi:MAG: hypothetical protein AAFY36_01590 [Bacteroidota bacterium]
MDNIERNWEDITRRYYAGETSLEEEKALRAYWLEASVPSVDTHLAGYFDGESRETSDIDWEKLSAQFVEEDSSATPSSGGAIVRRLTGQHFWRYAAAVVAIVCVAAWLPRLSESNSTAATEGFPVSEAVDWSRYEITDPAEAELVLRQSLTRVAKPWNLVTQAGKAIQPIQLLNNPLASKGQ